MSDRRPTPVGSGCMRPSGAPPPCSQPIAPAIPGASSPSSHGIKIEPPGGPPAIPKSVRPGRHARRDRNEPDANIRNFAPVARIMKSALPDNAKIAKEAKECMQECVSEFISFITSEGTQKSHAAQLQTTNTHSSNGKVPPGEAQNRQRRRHHIRHDIVGIRELRRGAEDLLGEIQRGSSTMMGSRADRS